MLENNFLRPYVEIVFILEQNVFQFPWFHLWEFKLPRVSRMFLRPILGQSKYDFYRATIKENIQFAQVDIVSNKQQKFEEPFSVVHETNNFVDFQWHLSEKIVHYGFQAR